MDNMSIQFTNQKKVISSQIRAVRIKLEEANATAVNCKKRDVLLEEEIKKDIAQVKTEIETLESILHKHQDQFVNKSVTLFVKETLDKEAEITELAWSHYEVILKLEEFIGQASPMFLCNHVKEFVVNEDNN